MPIQKREKQKNIYQTFSVGLGESSRSRLNGIAEGESREWTVRGTGVQLVRCRQCCGAGTANSLLPDQKPVTGDRGWSTSFIIPLPNAQCSRSLALLISVVYNFFTSNTLQGRNKKLLVLCNINLLWILVWRRL